MRYTRRISAINAPIIYPEERFVSTDLENANDIVAIITDRFLLYKIATEFIRVL
jgi:hypothetical protein